MQNEKETKIKDKTELGQVFTSKKVAKLMVRLLEPYIQENSNCLDPCIGKNIFLNQLDENICRLTGIENDSSLIDNKINSFYSIHNRELIIGDFFDLDLEIKYDLIIMNPPYVRQELMDDTKNSKKKVAEILNGNYPDIPKKSNLYVYFILKALKHLKNGGHLVAIIYDSWLYTDFGQKLKEIIINRFNLETIIHFRKGAFENVNVGATVILISFKRQDHEIKYYSYQSPLDLPENNLINPNDARNITINEFLEFHMVNGTILDYTNELFVNMDYISSELIKRGTSAIVNKFFIFNYKRFGDKTKKFVKNITKINKFSVDAYDYLLLLPKEEISDNSVNEYLKKLESIVKKNPEKYKNLHNKIRKNKYWYHINGSKRGNIIFNYYMRDNIHFIYNPSNLLISDNFYSLVVDDNIFENLCILNSNFTTYTLLKYGKNQGRGLFKIQLNKFKKVPIIDVNKLSEDSKIKLRKLGKELIKTRRTNSEKVISLIDNILVNEYNRYLNNQITRDYILKSIKDIRKGI